MEKIESSCSILRRLNLEDAEEVVSEAYHQEGAGRPPRNPMGIFKALIIKRVQQVPSDRELYRRFGMILKCERSATSKQSRNRIIPHS